MFAKLINYYLSLNNFFELNLKYLLIVGLWPEDLTKTKLILYKIYQYTLNSFAVIYLIVTSIETYRLRADLVMFLANFDKVVIAAHYFLKVICYFCHRQRIKALIDDIVHSGDVMHEENRRKIIYQMILITSVMTGIMSTFSIIGYYYGQMPCEAWLPFDAKKDKVSLAWAMLIMLSLFGVPFSYRAIAIQGVVCSLLLYLCDQLGRVQARLRACAAPSDLRDIVCQHVRLIRYATKIRTIFKEFFLIQNVAVTVELCLNAMMVTVLTADQKFLFVGFIATLGLALFNAYIYCYLGNELIDQSQAVGYAAYCSEWATWPAPARRGVLLLAAAAQRPLHLSAGVGVVGMRTYGAALYNGYTIFAVLNDVVDK